MCLWWFDFKLKVNFTTAVSASNIDARHKTVKMTQNNHLAVSKSVKHAVERERERVRLVDNPKSEEFSYFEYL
jgi:hypothetical protein